MVGELTEGLVRVQERFYLLFPLPFQAVKRIASINESVDQTEAVLMGFGRFGGGFWRFCANDDDLGGILSRVSKPVVFSGIVTEHGDHQSACFL